MSPEEFELFRLTCTVEEFLKSDPEITMPIDVRAACLSEYIGMDHPPNYLWDFLPALMRLPHGPKAYKNREFVAWRHHCACVNGNYNLLSKPTDVSRYVAEVTPHLNTYNSEHTKYAQDFFEEGFKATFDPEHCPTIRWRSSNEPYTSGYHSLHNAAGNKPGFIPELLQSWIDADVFATATLRITSLR